MDSNDFLVQLRAAFPATPIDAHDAFEQWGTTYPDAAAFAAQIAGQTWESLDRDYLVRNSDALGFLGTQTLVAVLPVYLRSLFEETVWSPATGTLLLILNPPGSPDDRGLGQARFDALIQALDPAQRTAIATALTAVANADATGSVGRAARAVLDGYWTSFAKGRTDP